MPNDLMCRGGYDHGGHDHDGGYGENNAENDGFREREFPTFDAHETWVFSVLYLLAVSATLTTTGFCL